MKMHKRLILISLLTLAALLLVAAPVSAKANVIQCTGTETLSQVLDNGTLWTTPSGHIKIRGMVEVYTESSSNALCAGSNTITFNANMDPSGVGPIWGTYQTASAAGGGFDGIYTGKSTASGYELHGSAIGTGSNRGLHAWVDDVNGTWQLRILTP